MSGIVLQRTKVKRKVSRCSSIGLHTAHATRGRLAQHCKRNTLTAQLTSLPRGRSVPQSGVAHVLEDDVAVVVGVAARVLVGPLDGEDGAGVIVEATHVVTTAVVVLGIEQPTEGDTKRCSQRTDQEAILAKPILV